MELPTVDQVERAICQLAAQLQVAQSEQIAIGQAAGRVLSEPLRADRDSPALDVSAMDGFAVRIADVGQRSVPVAGTIPAGSPAIEIPVGSAVRIFTGAPVPSEADCVVRREGTREEVGIDGATHNVFFDTAANALTHGQNIRRQGENVASGAEVLPVGTLVSSAQTAAIASFGPPRLTVRKRVRVTILNTGDELAQPGEQVEAWQVRDSNGPTLAAWLGKLSWVEVVDCRQVGDTLERVQDALTRALAESDAIILTGGVSMGDADYVPDAIKNIGGNIVFHRLPIRPGRPILGAAMQGKLLLGLPGNPVSVAVTARVFGEPLLRSLAGCSPSFPSRPAVELADVDGKRLDLIWYRLVSCRADGGVVCSPSRGSGDIVSLAQSIGFVEVAPGSSQAGPWPLYLW